ncbi:MAG: hypothetical protein JO197_18345 [Acidobacteria bacterium]|nr:hypothetical protein [Acidobacteriota bacterium]MBV9479065.1 hypothetical protein [Acidobacteriota bacterium]
MSLCGALAASAAEDVVTVGSLSAPKGSVLVPVYVRDLSATRLGIDKPSGQRIQSVGFRVRFSPAGAVTSAAFSRSGTLLKTPLYEKSFQGSDWLGYIASFAEANNALAFTSNAAAPGNLIGYLQLTTASSLAAGTVVNVTIDPTAALLGDQAGAVIETYANAGLVLQNGTITLTAGTCTTPAVSASVTGTAASCVLGTGGTASANVSGGTVAAYQWGYRITSNGSITTISGATNSSYTITGADFGGAGTKYLVVTVTPSCGAQVVSNEIAVDITTAPAVSLVASSTVFANSPDNYASVADQGNGATYTWSITNGTITSGQGTRQIRYTSGASGTVALGITVTKNGCSDPASPTANVTIVARPAGAVLFYLVTPCRLIDTRGPVGTYGGPASPSGSLRQVPVAGVCGIPSGARAIAANVTAVAPQTGGYLALFASDVAWAGTSTLNYRTGKTRANNAVLPLSADGRITVKNEGSTLNFIIDVTGYFK